jgi:hypothetical protein
MGIQSVIAEILFIRYVNSINTGTIEQRKKLLLFQGKMICRNASGNYVHAECENKMEQENASSATNESKKPRKA